MTFSRAEKIEIIWALAPALFFSRFLLHFLLRSACSGGGLIALYVLAVFDFFPNQFVALLQFMQFLVRQVFYINQVIAGRAVGADQFIQLQVEGLVVTVLGLLDQEDHQES